MVSHRCAKRGLTRSVGTHVGPILRDPLDRFGLRYPGIVASSTVRRRSNSITTSLAMGHHGDVPQKPCWRMVARSGRLYGSVQVK